MIQKFLAIVFLFLCSVRTNAENMVKSSPVQLESQLSLETNLNAITDANVTGDVASQSLNTLYKKFKRARNLRIAGIVCTVCGGFTMPVVGLPLLVKGCRKYKAYKRAGLDYQTVKYKYQQSLQKGIIHDTYIPMYNR